MGASARCSLQCGEGRSDADVVNRRDETLARRELLTMGARPN